MHYEENLPWIPAEPLINPKLVSSSFSTLALLVHDQLRVPPWAKRVKLQSFLGVLFLTCLPSIFSRTHGYLLMFGSEMFRHKICPLGLKVKLCTLITHFHPHPMLQTYAMGRTNSTHVVMPAHGQSMSVSLDCFYCFLPQMCDLFIR